MCVCIRYTTEGRLYIPSSSIPFNCTFSVCVLAPVTGFVRIDRRYGLNSTWSKSAGRNSQKEKSGLEISERGFGSEIGQLLSINLGDLLELLHNVVHQVHKCDSSEY
jgi:hypothetical protein